MSLPEEIVKGLSTKASKIRALDSAGLSRSEIAGFLGIRYQHVRNTLVQAKGSSDSDKRLPEAPVDRSMEKLTAAGFDTICECILVDHESFRLSAGVPHEPGVYAFVVDRMIKYIGLSQTGLGTRLGHYVSGHPGQKTSHRIKLSILEALTSGSTVKVLIAQPPELDWNGLPVNCATGLEAGLIRLLKPKWNLQGVR